MTTIDLFTMPVFRSKFFLTKITYFFHSILKRSRPNRAVYLSRVSHNLRRVVSNGLNKNVAITLDKGDYIT
jgi:hypothetical protein